MIYFIHEFDAREGVSDARMHEIYENLVEGWQKAWPTNRFMGLFSRRLGLGPDPKFMAIWEMPNFAAFDEWSGTWEEVKYFMQDLEDRFHSSVVHQRSRVMTRLMPPA